MLKRIMMTAGSYGNTLYARPAIGKRSVSYLSLRRRAASNSARPPQRGSRFRRLTGAGQLLPRSPLRRLCNSKQTSLP